MCGIAGFVGEQYGSMRGADLVRRMTAVQKHRGPDGEGFFAGDGCCLGHRRLAILDLSVNGAQPMSTPDGRWTIVFNGEIFNYLELREQLGGGFTSGSDTEVLLRACAEWGVEKTLEQCVGMFAFGLWDARERCLTLARDRVGEKPLVYFQRGGVLAFASELKALDSFHERRLDASAMDAYLALGYIPAPLAIFEGCQKLEPGHLLRFKDGRLHIHRWWRPEQRALDSSGASSEERAGQLRQLLAGAVKIRLRSDVPVAIFLSGGVDSSVVAAACASSGARIEAFTADFGGGHPDLGHARQVAAHLGLPHEVLPIDPVQAAGDFEQLLWHYDEPFADSSSIPTFALARRLKGRYRVVLNGEGGDEAFGGYPHYERVAAKQVLKAAAVAAGWKDGSTSVYVESKAVFRQDARARLLNGYANGNSLAWLLKREGYRVPSSSRLKQAMWSDRHLYLPNDLTYKVDIALSASGVEGRAPFLDHRLLEWAQTLPEGELVNGADKKVLLRAAYKDALPSGVLSRAKQGFGAPVEKWLSGPLREMAAEAIPSPLLEPELQKNLKGQRLWMMVAFAQWARQWRATW